MTILDHKIDFAVVFSVTKANPNGDPLNGNRPRQNYDGLGEVSDVALKRKIRNRLQDLGEPILSSPMIEMMISLKVCASGRKQTRHWQKY